MGKAVLVIATAALAIKQPQGRLWTFEQDVVPHILSCFYWKDLEFWHEADLIEPHHWMALGTICEREGRQDTAERLFKLASDKIDPKRTPEILQARLQLEIGTLYMRQRKFELAREIFGSPSLVAASELNDGGDNCLEDINQIQLSSFLNYALYWEENSGFVESEPLFVRVLDTSEELYGLNHRHTVRTLDLLATKYLENGQYDKARMVWRRALLSLKECFDPEGPIVFSTQYVLADVCKKQGRYSESEKLYRQVLASHERRLGIDHPSSINLESKVAVLNDLQGHFEESRRLYEHVLVGRQRTLGSQHPKTLAILENQALSHRMQGDYQEAERLYQRVLHRREKATDNPSEIQRTAMRLADLRSELNRRHL